MRSILTNNDMRDGWIYWGYGLHQHPTIVNRLMHTLLGPKNGSDCEHASEARMKQMEDKIDLDLDAVARMENRAHSHYQ